MNIPLYLAICKTVAPIDLNTKTNMSITVDVAETDDISILFENENGTVCDVLIKETKGDFEIGITVEATHATHAQELFFYLMEISDLLPQYYNPISHTAGGNLSQVFRSAIEAAVVTHFGIPG